MSVGSSVSRVGLLAVERAVVVVVLMRAPSTDAVAARSRRLASPASRRETGGSARASSPMYTRIVTFRLDGPSLEAFVSHATADAS
jgi:hypothetical protein